MPVFCVSARVCVKDMVFDLEDLKMWEPVLYGAASKKQLILDVLKKKTETKMMSRISKDEEVCVFILLLYLYYVSVCVQISDKLKEKPI